MSERNTLLTYSEDPEVASELQSVAAEVCKGMNLSCLAVTINAPADDIDRLSKVARDEVVSVTVAGQQYITPEVSFEVLKRISDSRRPRLLLIGSTRDGKELAGMLSSYLDCGVATDCIAVSSELNQITVRRATFGGRVTATAALLGDCAVVAVRPHAYRPPVTQSTAKVIHQEFQDIPVKVLVEKISQKAPSTVDLTKADRIVSVGRGLKKKEDLVLIQQLADALSASVGCSRPLSADLGWLPEESHIGLTGVQVKPKLYVAIGISGQLQHIAGMKDSGVVVAINTDKSAPIFQNCDYGIVGDMYQVVPELTRQLQQLKAKR
ncbi:MAG: electron transfer flavoprotein subunit alpha/FixB family protein [Conexivisphaerales archaeon]